MNSRTLIVAVAIALAVVADAAAQTPFAIARVAGETIVAKADPGATADEQHAALTAASAANAWIGGQLGYKFGKSDALGDNLLVSASVIHDIPLDSRRFRLPVISNFASLVKPSDTAEGAAGKAERDSDKLKELMLGSGGIRAGLYPYREILGWQKKDFHFVIHGEASWKINGFKQEDSDETRYVNQLRLGAGIEMAIGIADDDHRPLTLSITPVLTRFNGDEYEKVFTQRKTAMNTWEVVAVMPIAARTGVLFEYVRGDVSSFRAGVIVVGEK